LIKCGGTSDPAKSTSAASVLGAPALTCGSGGCPAQLQPCVDFLKGTTMKPRGQLMIEHRLIEKLLKSAASLAKRLTSETYDPILIDAIVDFITTYADRTHHGKEEDILFRELAKKNLAGDNRASMNELVAEHRQARGKVQQLTALNEKYKSGDKSVIGEIKDIILWLADFYPSHIRKEDKDFFPRTEKYFSEQELQDLLEDFWVFDRKLIHEKYKSILEKISDKTIDPAIQ
jgi:hemerythrin-like domain-containing protein